MSRITDLTAITTPALTDFIALADVSDTTYAASGTDRKMLLSYIMRQHSGTAFPVANLWDGMPFWRTDLGGNLKFTYDGTRWLSEVFTIGYEEVNQSSALNRPFRIVNYGLAVYFPPVNIEFTTKVRTTNNGTDYWTFTLSATDSVLANATTLHTFTTAADAADAFVAHDDVPDSNTPANADGLLLVKTKAASGGNHDYAFHIAYQLIGA